jgi:AmmeMemoRadiSam system protein B
MSVRLPAFAGSFYEERPEKLESDVRRFLDPDAEPRPALGAIVPHAGYVYSGPVAGAVYARLRVPGSVVVLCPKTSHPCCSPLPT